MNRYPYDPYTIDWGMVASKALLSLVVGGLLALISVLIYRSHVEFERIEAACAAHGETVIQTYNGPACCVRKDGTLVKR